MKKVNFTLSVAATLVLLISYGKATAQTARLQLIHNAAAVALDTVDVYLDNTKFDNVAFRTATQLLTVASGAHTINVNDRNSADSGDMVVSRFALTLTVNQNHIAMIAGLDVPANYDVNPNAVATDLSLIVRNNVSISPTSNTQTALNFFHGTTDAPTWDIYLRPSSSLIANDVKYGDASANMMVNSVLSVIDVRNSAGTTVVKAYDLPLNLFAKKSLAVFASGFRTPASNQNGAAFDLFVVDTNGGPAVMLSEVTRIQFINNSPDIIVDTVDIWVDNTKIADNLAFRKASTFHSIVPGIHDITIAKKFSTDTSAAVVLFKSSVSFIAGKTHVAVVHGVVDTAQYAPNPDGLAPVFRFSLLDLNKEGALAGQVDLGFYTGTHDLQKIDFNKINAPASKIANGLMYNSVAAISSFTAGNLLFNLTSDDSSVFLGAYKLSATALATKGGIVMTSGLYDTIENPAQAKKMGLFAFFNDGTVIELPKLTSELQIIHNSADVTADTVDIYVNGVKTLANFAFRTATPFMYMDALVPYKVAIALKGSANAGAAFYNTTLVLDSGKNHYAVANGVRNIAQYVANPNGRNIAFKLHTYSGARKVASNSKNTDLLYFHGSTDLRTTTIIGVGQIQFLSKNDSYGDFHGYAIHSAQDNIRYDVMDAAADTALKTGLFASIASHQGKAGLIFASGFYKANAGTNQNGDSLVLFVVWPDGDVDSIAPPKPITGLKEVIAEAALSIYPNPAKDVVNISLELNTQSMIMSEVIDITGRTVLSEENKATKGKNILTVSTISLNPGIYFLSIRAGDQIITRKIAISR